MSERTKFLASMFGFALAAGIPLGLPAARAADPDPLLSPKHFPHDVERLRRAEEKRQRKKAKNRQLLDQARPADRR